jgi:hypothetical protein
MGNEILFLYLVRQGLGTSNATLPSLKIDWDEIKSLAIQQELSAVVIDGVEKLISSNKPSGDMLLEWIGEVLQDYEYRYESYRRTISEMAGFYNSHGYKMMVLKGYACSQDWPKPEHRACGDIDIWQFGKQKEADDVLSKEKGIKIDDSHEHHTVFLWHDFIVENHYDFIDIHHRKSSPQLEAILKQLGTDDGHYILVDGQRVYLPSPNLHALFLLRHCMEHFASTSIKLRQLLDWGFFVQKHTKEIDWKWLMGVLEEFGMIPAFNIFNGICVEDLGFNADIFPIVQFDPFLKERVFNDILEPEFSGETPKYMIPRLFFKFRRWKANGWKNELCFKENMWSAFWSGVWGKILKPSQI